MDVLYIRPATFDAGFFFYSGHSSFSKEQNIQECEVIMLNACRKPGKKSLYLLVNYITFYPLLLLNHKSFA